MSLSRLFAILAIALPAIGTEPPARAEGPSPPNIILIVADDLGYGDMGCYGRDDVKTPHLDAMARAGLRFTDFHSNGAVCSPTRAALMTGRYQQRSGIEGVVTAAGHRHTGLPLAEITIAEMLQVAGYRTALLGKWHLGYEPKFGPNQQGFDEFRGFVSGNVDYQSHIDQVGRPDWWRDGKLEPDEGYLTERITDYAVNFIKQNQRRPFFLYLAHGAPHYPIQGPEDPAIRSPGKPNRQQGGRQEFLEGYRQMIETLDDSVARIRQSVRAAGLESNTLIVFMSDNGPAERFGGEAGKLRGGKGTLYEGGHRVPCLAVMPGKIAAGESRETVMGFDWAATFAAIAGARIAAERPLDGVDLSSLLFDGESLPQRDLFWSRGAGSSAVRSGDWKLIVEQRRVELFDLKDDFQEATNVADQHPEVVDRLQRKVKAWEQEVRRNVERRS